MDFSTLNSLDKIKILDSQNMLGSIDSLGKQMAEIRSQFADFILPSDFRDFANVLFLGTGGSTLGSHVIKSLTVKTAPIPFEMVHGYDLPAYVNSKTLAIVISYSGTTEEALTTMKKAKEVGAKLVVISSGGEMATWAKENNVPSIHFTVQNNPCNSPRMGGGYMLTAQLLVLSLAKLVNISNADLDLLQNSVSKAGTIFGVANTNNNLAKQISASAQNKSVWYIAAEHLVGNAHIAANQMNENAKRFAGYFLIPELNHHLMEGLINPTTNSENLLLVLLESESYSEKIKKRFAVTKEILKKNKIDFFAYECNGPTPLAEVGEILSLSSHASFYTAILAGIDPTAIPFVDFFKEQLKK